MWLGANGPRQIAVFEDFEVLPFIDDHDDQWSVEGEQIHSGAVTPDAHCGCFVERNDG